MPWVKSVHSDLIDIGVPRDTALPNFIFVSQTMAHLHKSQRFVLNGLDPEEFIYSETKNPYFLFVISGSINKALRKGLDTAFFVANQAGTKLVVAGGSGYRPEMALYADLCRATDRSSSEWLMDDEKPNSSLARGLCCFPLR